MTAVAAKKLCSTAYKAAVSIYLPINSMCSSTFVFS